MYKKKLHLGVRKLIQYHEEKVSRNIAKCDMDHDIHGQNLNLIILNIFQEFKGKNGHNKCSYGEASQKVKHYSK